MSSGGQGPMDDAGMGGDGGQGARETERAWRAASPAVSHDVDSTEQLPVYHLPGDGLSMGPSLGNGHCWITTKSRGAVNAVFSSDLGQNIAGALLVRYSGLGCRLDLMGDRVSPNDGGFVQLRAEHPGMLDLHAAYVRHRFPLPGELRVRETVFVPRGTRHVATGERAGDPAAVYLLVEVSNHARESRAVRVYGFAQLRGDTAPDIRARFDPARHALVAANASHPEWTRVFGATVPVSAYETTTNASLVYDVSHMPPLRNQSDTTGGHVLGALQVDLNLAPGEECHLAFVLAFSRHGEAAALADFDASRDAAGARDATIAYYRRAIRPAEVLTPDPAINRGALWAKVNMLRVMADYPTGPAFTNDPSRSSAVVGRDAFWFVYGCDHILPHFSCGLLRAFAVRQEPSGKIIEYYHAVTGQADDYGLNINDNTPLFILAVNHHWRATGHRDCVGACYDSVARAARYIIAQEDERGLVFCTATGEELQGIIGWRNIIPNYRISGAVTEVNAECAAALRAAGHLAENLGRNDDASEFRAAAERLTDAINRHLINPDNGLYYLNIDVDGEPRTDVTSDEVFPVIFRVAPEDVAFRIISNLNVHDFWTEAGLRTTSAESPDYDPAGHWGLLGGVWPGVTWWYGFAAARYDAGGMVRALRASFQHYARAPKLHNTVPGQFSEWFDGESLVNRGMRLSPWEAPRFLWAAIEGVGGVMVRPAPLPPVVSPLLPLEWKWVGLRRLPYHGTELSYFAGRFGTPSPGADATHAELERQAGVSLRFFASGPIAFGQGQAGEIFDEDITDKIQVVNDALRCVAFRRAGELFVCVGNTAERTSVGAVELDGLVEPTHKYQLELYNSERGQWSSADATAGSTLIRVAFVVEAQGFRVLRIRAAG